MHQEHCKSKTDKPRGKQNLLNKLENAQMNRKNAKYINPRGQSRKQLTA